MLCFAQMKAKADKDRKLQEMMDKLVRFYIISYNTYTIRLISFALILLRLR